MDDGFEVHLDRQWRPALVAVSLSEISKGSFQRYNEMSEDIIKKMVVRLNQIAPICLSFNAGSWVRSRRFHIKAYITVEMFCEKLKSDGQSAPSAQQKKSLQDRSSLLEAPKAAAEFAKGTTTKVFKSNGFTFLRLADTFKCNFSFLKMTPATDPENIKEVVETFEKKWFAKQYAMPNYGFAVYMFPAMQEESFDLFVRIDPDEYKRLFPNAKASFGSYRAPKRKYRE